MRARVCSNRVSLVALTALFTAHCASPTGPNADGSIARDATSERPLAVDTRVDEDAEPDDGMTPTPDERANDDAIALDAAAPRDEGTALDVSAADTARTDATTLDAPRADGSPIDATRPDAPRDVAVAPEAGAPDGRPPIANAGADVTITWPVDRAALMGTQTGGLTVRWSQVSGPSTAVLRDPSQLTPIATSLRVGAYVFRLTVTDNESMSASDDVRVTVAPDTRVVNTAVGHVLAQTSPVFRRANRLPPLSFGFFPHLEFNRRAAEKYRYALHIGDPTTYWADLARAYRDRPAEIINLAASDAETYRISINVTGYNTFYDCPRQQRIRAMNEQFAMHHMDGSLWTRGTAGCFEFNPTAGRDLWRAFAIDTGIPANMQAIQAAAASHGARIAVINDLGEYGLGYAALGEARWSDPAWSMWMLSSAFWEDSYVRAAWGALPSSSNYGRAIIERAYAGISDGKAVQQAAIAELLVAATHPEVLYTLFLAGPATHTGRYNEWGQTAWDHRAFVSRRTNNPTSVYSAQMYYGDNSEGGLGVAWTSTAPDGARPADHFTHALAAAANAISAGSPRGYVWISPKGRHASSFVDRAEMMGFLKAYYCLSMVGGPLFYEFFNAGRDTDPATTSITTLPTWMETLIAMGEVHALYSHLDTFLYEGRVLANAHGDTHPFTRWVTPFALYEQYAYPVGAAFRGPRDASPTVDRTVRVVARVNNAGTEWLVAGWAASGADRDVDVELPAPLGRTTLRMRRAGSVYRLRREGSGTVAELLDLDAMRPTDHMLESD